MTPKVSLIICTYNAKDDLQQCLSSLEAQTYENFEIIIVNDASTDHTADFLDQYRDSSSLQINVVTNGTNLGVAGSRNVGIRQARGEVIAFTDADCTSDPAWLSELLKGFDQPNVAAVGGKIVDHSTDNIWELTNKGHNYVAPEAGYVTYIQGCNMSFSQSILNRYMFNDELKYGYEEKLLCDLLTRDGYKISYNPNALVYHKHRNTLKALVRQKYLRGFSSIWYRKKQHKFFMFKRHIIMLLALLTVPFAVLNNIFLYAFLLLTSAFLSSILRDEKIFGAKTTKEIILTFPFLVFIEFSHFWGSIVGLLEFRVFRKTIND